METSVVAIRAVEQAGDPGRSTRRATLEGAARLLPDSDLKSAILATLADREPTRREALAWIAALQAHRRVRD